MTGTWCTYCPAMTSALKKVEELMPGRMVKMAFHSSSSSATDPFHLSQTSTIMDFTKSNPTISGNLWN